MRGERRSGLRLESRAYAVNWALKSALYMTGFAAANKTWSEKDVQETFWWGRCELDAVKDAYWQTWANLSPHEVAAQNIQKTRARIYRQTLATEGLKMQSEHGQGGKTTDPRYQ